MRSKTLFLLLILLLGSAIRFVLPFSNNFEKLPLHGPDAHYHTRRVILAIKNYPDIPTYDRYLSYPAGGHIIWPPGYDFVGATLGYFFLGKNAAVGKIEWLCAIYPIFWGLLSILLTFLLGRTLCNDTVGLLASFFVAVFPCNVWWSSLGYNDHHIVESITLILLTHSLIRKPAKRILDWVILGIIMGTGMLFWQGSILFAGLVFLICLVSREYLSALGFLVALIVILPFSLNTHFVDSPFSYRGLSLLHLTLLFIAILVMSILLLWKMNLRFYSFLVGFLLTILVCFLFRQESFRGGFSFIIKKDPWLSTILEFYPLMIYPGFIETITLKSLYGYSYYIWPIGVFMMLWENRRKEFYIFSFFAVFAGIMAFIARRYSVWFSSFYAVILSYLILHIYGLVSKILKFFWVGYVFCCGIVLLVMVPVIKYGYNKMHWIAYSPITVSALQWLKHSTPKTSFYFNPRERPEYGIMCSWNDGHRIIYHAQRPVTLSNFGNDVPNFHYANGFFVAESESAANEIMDSLNCKYVYLANWQYDLKGVILYLGKSLSDYFDFFTIKDNYGINHKMMVPKIKGYSVALSRLYRFLGSGSYIEDVYFPPYRHYRLRYASEDNSIRIFEYVKGAVIIGRTVPNTCIKMSYEVKLPKIVFNYFDSLCADAEGNFEITVPYPTGDTGSYKIIINNHKPISLKILEEDILNGDTIYIRRL